MPFRQLKSFLKILIGVQYKELLCVCHRMSFPVRKSPDFVSPWGASEPAVSLIESEIDTRGHFPQRKQKERKPKK